MKPMDHQDLLADLAHDLGKYIRLPLAMLPLGADDDAVRAAAEDALLRTRRGPSGITSAAEIWNEFLGELDAEPAWLLPLREAVERALAYVEDLHVAPTDQIRADLEAVTPAIRVALEAAGG